MTIESDLSRLSHRDVVSCDVVSCDVVSCDVVSCDVVSCDVVSCDVVIQNPSRYPESGARLHRPWLEPLVATLAPAAESFVVRFIGGREMRRLNEDFRGRVGVTDVLSFPDRDESYLDCPAEQRDGHLGDIAICVPVARRQADEQDHGVHRELQILMLHGLLHCLGYDHETDNGTMERLEDRLRQQWLERVAI